MSAPLPVEAGCESC